MPYLRARELRNDLGRVLRRVSSGERLRITLRGKPVAELVPVSTRPRTMPSPAFWAAVAGAPADVELARELREALPGDTDDISG